MLMIESYKTILDRGVSKKKQFNGLFTQLKKLRDQELVKIFQRAHEQAFKEIDCLSCANCCSIVGPLLLDQDIARLSKHLHMDRNTFVKTYLTIDEDNDWVFSTHPCPFLLDDNTCFVYKDRPKACREYPHTDQKYIHRYLSQTKKNTQFCPAIIIMLEYIQEHF